MSCNCATPANLNSWIDLVSTPPRDPLDLIARAQIVSGYTDVGVRVNSTTYGDPGAAWAASPFALSLSPICFALETTDAQRAADAAMWNFTHQTIDQDQRIAPQNQRLLFLRGDPSGAYQMNIPIALGGTGYSKLELSFLDNNATRGDYRGTYPVIQWTAHSYTGNISLQLILKQMGRVRFGLSAFDGTNYSMFDFEAIIVP